MIHADLLHLVGNMVGIALFGAAVATLCGWGLGWLMVLVSGGLGNALNAVFFGANTFRWAVRRPFSARWEF